MNFKYLLLVSYIYIFDGILCLIEHLFYCVGMALGLGESDKTTAKQILRRRQLPLKDFEQKTGMFTI